MLKHGKKLVLIFSVFAVLLFIGAAFPGFSDDAVDSNRQRIIPVDSEIYDLVDLLSLESGKSVLSAIKPWSEAELLNVLSQFDYDALSGAGKNTLDRINKLIEKTPFYTEDGFAVDVTVEAALEAYLHTSEDEAEWVYGYEERLPVLSIPMEAWFNEGFYGYIEPSLKESRFLITETDDEGNYTGNLTNIPAAFTEIDYHFPFRGFLAAGGDNWNLQLGRDRLEYGNGETGKLLLSSYPDFYDFFRLKGFTDNFAFTWSLVSLESWTDQDSAQRYLADHALEVRLFDFLSLSVNESALFYGEAVDLQFMGPLIVYHNLIRNNFITDDTDTETGANICMTLSFNAVPVKGLELYGEYLLDEIQTAQEQDQYGSGVTSTPNADAYLLGLKASLPLGRGYLHGFFEYVYTSPWCYLLDPAGASMAWTHREASDIMKTRVNIIKPLGYESGPDTIAFGGSVGYIMPSVFDVNINIDYIIKGENDIETEYVESFEAAQLTTPTGIPENRFILGLSGSYQVFDFFAVELNLAWVNINNYGHVSDSEFSDLQSALSLVFEI